MAFVCLEAVELTAEQLAALRRRIERPQTQLGDVLSEASIPTSLDYLKPGRTFGIYREEIVQREVRLAGVPSWFNAMDHVGEMCVITPGGYRCYVRLRVNEQARSEPSIFEAGILALVEEDPEQGELFTLIDDGESPQNGE